LWNSAGFALVVVDARGTGASFGSRTMELGPREIADYGELIDWMAAQPWSNGRVGLFGASYDGQAAELVAGLGNPHVTAVAALFSPVDPYRELFYPGGCATGGRFARWMCESQIKDGVAGAVERLSELTGRPAGEIAPPTPVKGVDWQATTAGALRRLATFANQQEVEIGPWGHGGRTYADTLRPDGRLAGDRLVREGQDRRLVEFFTRYVERAEAPDGQRNLTYPPASTSPGSP
jgi:predicted acyl esterase